jgi:hypothetical protein
MVRHAPEEVAMAHVQQQLLDAIKARLIAGNTAAGDDVFLDRLDPLPKGKRAAILIAEGDHGEDIVPATLKEMQQRTLDVVVTCALRSCDDVIAEAREFGLAVEKLLSPKSTNTALLAIAKNWTIVNSRLAKSGEGEEAVASRVQLWQFTYYVRKAEPDVAI